MSALTMPNRTRAFLQARCLQVSRQQLGCKYLEAVLIGRIKPLGSGPNWEVLAFRAELPPIAQNEAMKAVDVLRGTYALAPYTTSTSE
jgi:hypothetical protein